jgi:hypothetical protein
MMAELLAPVLGRVRRHERAMWTVLIALLLALVIAALARFGLGGD